MNDFRPTLTPMARALGVSRTPLHVPWNVVIEAWSDGHCWGYYDTLGKFSERQPGWMFKGKRKVKTIAGQAKRAVKKLFAIPKGAIWN